MGKPIRVPVSGSGGRDEPGSWGGQGAERELDPWGLRGVLAESGGGWSQLPAPLSQTPTDIAPQAGIISLAHCRNFPGVGS